MQIASGIDENNNLKIDFSLTQEEIESIKDIEVLNFNREDGHSAAINVISAFDDKSLDDLTFIMRVLCGEARTALYMQEELNETIEPMEDDDEIQENE